MLSSVLFRIYRAFPAGARFWLRTHLKGMVTHGASSFDGIISERDARGKKRLDIAAKEITKYLSIADIRTLSGKTCVDFGCGWVLSDAVVFYLLGARKVFAVDYNPILQISALVTALEECDETSLLETLEPFHDRKEVEQRLAILKEEIKYTRINRLDNLPIEILSPFNIAELLLPEPVDFIWSISVLEHVPRDQIRAVIENLGKSLANKGSMLHIIDLTDHKDRIQNPFGFLDNNTDYDPEDPGIADRRGNRILSPKWEEYFLEQNAIQTYLIQAEPLPANTLPKKIIAEASEYSIRQLAVEILVVGSRHKES